MKNYYWNEEKNNWLKQERNISFEEVIQAINYGDLLDVIKHPNSEKYAHQSIFIVKIKNYIYCVPYVENKDDIFLKTIFPSRKMSKIYLGE
jgi:uncharacterized DUF497 family protein